MSDKLQKIAEEIQGLTLLEAADLVKILEEKLGVVAAAPVAVAAAVPGAAAAAPAEAEEEQTEFDVLLKEVGAKKIQVIKAVRQIVPSLGLREAKELVDGAPSTVLQAVSKAQAEDAKAKLEAEGATVEMK
jgi:large subunit ribosomal protein L7/L12